MAIRNFAAAALASMAAAGFSTPSLLGAARSLAFLHARFSRAVRAALRGLGRTQCSGRCDEIFSSLAFRLPNEPSQSEASEGAPRRFPPSWRTWDSGVVNSDIGGPGWSRSPLQELQDHLNAPGNLTLLSVGLADLRRRHAPPSNP